MTPRSRRTEAPLIPREVLFGNPDKAMPQISPDGSRMAYLAPKDGVLNVWVGTVGQDDYHPVTHDQDRGIRVFFWAHDARHVMYLQDAGGDENWRLFSVDLETGAESDLTPFDEVQVQIVHHDKHRPNELLIAMNLEDRRLHDVYHLDLTTRELAEAANGGDETALEIFGISGSYLGKGVSILIDILNPERIVIGSVYARNPHLFDNACRRVIEREAIPSASAVCEVVPAALGDKVGDYASLSVAMNQ